jgi:GTP cyclohydrolase I
LLIFSQEQQLAGRLNVQAQQTIDKVTSRLKKAAIEEAAIAKVILDRLKKEQFDIICAYPIKGKTLCSNLGDVGRAGPFCFCKTHAGKMSANASVRREFLRRMEHHFDKIKRALPPGLESATIENNLETLIDEAINSGEFSN